MTRYSPFSPRGRFGDPLSVMRQEFSRMVDDFGRFAVTPPASMGGARMGLARVDMSETEDALDIEIEAPGVEERGLDISLRGDLLTVRAMRETVRDEHDRNWHVRERANAGVTRTITLPFPPDPNSISARLEHGVLHIHVPKGRNQAARSVRIAIGGEAPGANGGPQGAVDPAI